MTIYTNDFYSLQLPEEGGLVYTTTGGRTHVVGGPRFPVDGVLTQPHLVDIAAPALRQIAANGTEQIIVRSRLASLPDVSLETIVRVAADSAVVRFRYVLWSSGTHRLSAGGSDGGGAGHDLVYLSLSHAPSSSLTEIRFSEFNEMIHSFTLVEEPVSHATLRSGIPVMGPMLVVADSDGASLLAYEHGSQYPDAYLAFRADETADGEDRVALSALKGNYLEGEPLDQPEGFETVWFQFAAVGGERGEVTHAAAGRDAASEVDTLAAEYRRFQLRYATENVASRTPYIFYNTWAYQERNKWWNGRTFLESMRHDRIMQEIDRAHRMGIDVFVLDTGWYEKTGDWTVSRKRFPDGLAEIREALDARGMKLGLWFNPKIAAVSSRMLEDHQDCIMSWRGKQSEPHPVWETEESHGMCLVSRYWEAFADELIRLVRELGVTYLKWDAIGQYGCDDPNHFHGDESHSAQERADSYAFNIGRYMSKVVDRLCRVCPEAIVDFDITEGKRYMGLGFLASGKYFLINNGPYYQDFDVPAEPGRWTNVFVHPGPARPRICRSPLTFDKWIPSVLFLTHYLPDDPAESQVANVASLMLGQNGIWGDLIKASDEGVELIGSLLARYKQVRSEITAADPVRTGTVGGGAEVHEKIDATTGRGMVVAFLNSHSGYAYVTSRPVSAPYYVTDGVEITLLENGHARIVVPGDRPRTGIVFFGAS